MDLDKLLAFNQLVMEKTEEEKKALARQFNIDYEEYKRRKVGKEKEADFIIIMKSLEVLKHFEAYDEGLSHILYLEALQDRMSVTNQDIIQNGEFTVITEYSDSDAPHFIPEYEFLLAPVNHMRRTVNKNTIQYTYQLAISERNFSFLSVQMLRYLFSKLVDSGMEIIVFRDNNGYAFKDYAINFWDKR